MPRIDQRRRFPNTLCVGATAGRSHTLLRRTICDCWVSKPTCLLERARILPRAVRKDGGNKRARPKRHEIARPFRQATLNSSAGGQVSRTAQIIRLLGPGTKRRLGPACRTYRRSFAGTDSRFQHPRPVFKIRMLCSPHQDSA